jgi:aminoglycoside 6'-N-acetyltransferase
MVPVQEITFRRLTRDDFPLLGRWLAEPHVARWWNHEPDPAALERDFGDAIDGVEPSEDLVVLLDDEPVGLVQYSRFADYPGEEEEMAAVYPVPPGATTIDYLIGDPAATGRGLGRRIIGALVARVWAGHPDVTCIVVPVASANEASWRALLGAGFRRVGRGRLTPDNPADDGWHEVLRIDRP